ncbi:WD-40 repeat protein [Thecamonas trahens ATCC 50062]|uniref:WD-40 repeat protein n=1 Tax=Thecamonas trahens ATCC 50062 TaxID=461836 RepID=A0A0L0D707_THETB|nr:WD-40 repeat protein [Thecamonas trahens ATCC 50062]KNC47886.1 WD-40 repeat protein [Thecamonas trahens ATCC 50062]|eukprot:XP_013758908.1 WD-40 repeat protein [Thecamonas trahens ATCC 50062]
MKVLSSSPADARTYTNDNYDCDIFICHGSLDKSLARNVRKNILARYPTLRVFVDDESLDGIRHPHPDDCAAIDVRSRLVLILDTNFVVTRYVIAEVDAALVGAANGGNPVFPVFIDSDISLAELGRLHSVAARPADDANFAAAKACAQYVDNGGAQAEVVFLTAHNVDTHTHMLSLVALLDTFFTSGDKKRQYDTWHQRLLAHNWNDHHIRTAYRLMDWGLATYDDRRISSGTAVVDIAQHSLAILAGTMQLPSRMPPPSKLPEYYPLPDTRAAVIDALLGANNVSVVGVSGLGGVGKSSLAADVAVHPAITSVFSVFWLALGEDKTSPIAIASRMSYFLKQGLGCAVDPQADLNYLQSILADKTQTLADAGTRILLILDDAWTTRQATAFTKPIAARHAVLVTSRNAAMAAISTSSVQLGTFGRADAAVVLRNYLAKGSPEWANTLALNDHRIVSLATFCRGHALALAILGSSISGEAALDAAVANFDSASKRAFRKHRKSEGGTDAKHAHIFDIITWTLGDAIPKCVRKVALAIYAMLGVFPSDTPVDVANFRATVPADDIGFAAALDALADASLLRVVAKDGGAITVIEMHDLHLKYIRHRLEVCFDDIPSLPARHLAVVAGVPPPGATPESAKVAITSGTASNWIVTRGISHMIAAGANHAAVAVALSWAWMKARADESLGGLLNDLRCVVRLGCKGAQHVGEVERALSLSREIIQRGKSYIETELVARLDYPQPSDTITQLVAAVRADASHGAFLPAAAIDPVTHRDARRLYCHGEYDDNSVIGDSLVAGICRKNVEVSDMLPRARVECLKGHTSMISGVIALPSTNGELPVLVSWSSDETIRVWHPAEEGTGSMRYTADTASCEVLKGHISSVTGVVALPSASGQLPVLVSRVGGYQNKENAIRVWHPADDGTGAMRYTAENASCEVLDGHTSWVSRVIALPSADRQLPVLVSRSRDKTIRVWHPADDGTGAMRYTTDNAFCEVLKGHTNWVLDVIALAMALPRGSHDQHRRMSSEPATIPHATLPVKA